jgi:hypothetical protein
MCDHRLRGMVPCHANYQPPPTTKILKRASATSSKGHCSPHSKSTLHCSPHFFAGQERRGDERSEPQRNPPPSRTERRLASGGQNSGYRDMINTRKLCQQPLTKHARVEKIVGQVAHKNFGPGIHFRSMVFRTSIETKLCCHFCCIFIPNPST